MSPAADHRPPRRRWLVAEYVLGFFGLVGAYAFAGSPGGPIPVLLLGGGLAVVWLRRQPDFVAADLVRAPAVLTAMPSILVVWAAATVAGSAVVAVLRPADLFDMPRQQPLLWLAVVTFYPLRTRSLLAASPEEHALYGVAAFTIGLGDLFCQGSSR